MLRNTNRKERYKVQEDMETLWGVVRGCLTLEVRFEKQFEGSKEVNRGTVWDEMRRPRQKY